MSIHHNPALYEEPQNQPMKVIHLSPRESLLSWLESTGRLQAIESDEFPDQKVPDDLDSILDPELYGLENEEDQLE